MKEQSEFASFRLVTLLLVAGLISSLYLTYLDYEVRTAGPDEVASFCALSKKFNCVTVADSKYSTFLGVPIAVLGIEYYAFMLALLLLSLRGILRPASWESLIFFSMGLSLPACAVLAYISMFIICSVCIVCCCVYAVNILTFLHLGFARKWSIRGFFLPELVATGRVLGSKRAFLNIAALAVIGLSQFVWLPEILSQVAPCPPAGGGSEGGIPLEAHGSTTGPENAPVQIEEFTDFQCPFCAKAHYAIKDLLAAYPGKIHHRLRHYPLDNACNPNMSRPFHPSACRAAVYSVCAAKQDLFSSFQELLWANRSTLSEGSFKDYAAKVGLDGEKLSRCLNDPETLNVVLNDISEAEKGGGIDGTPTFWINGEKVVGYRPFEFWKTKVESILSPPAQGGDK